MASKHLYTLAVLLGFLLINSIKARAESIECAGYGEKKLSNVVVVGNIFCDTCLKHQFSEEGSHVITDFFVWLKRPVEGEEPRPAALSDNKASDHDEQTFTLVRGHRQVWNVPEDELIVERTGEFNSINVEIPDLIQLAISVVPITEEDNRVHKYETLSTNCFAHLAIEFKYRNLSPAVEGVLGQTYRPDFKNPVKSDWRDVTLSSLVRVFKKKIVSASLYL